MVLSKLRNLKEEVQKNYRKKNNLPKEQRNSLNKLNSLVKNRHIVICSSDKDGKIVILNYEDYNSIMLRELKDFETAMVVGSTISEHFEQIRATCNSLMITLHKLKIVNDRMLLHTTGMKLYEKLYCKVPGAIAKFFRCNTPAYAYPLFKTNKLFVEELLHAEVADIPVRLLQSAGNIPTSRITALEVLQPISVQYCSGSPNKFCIDSRHYIEDLISWQKNKQRKL